MNVILVIVFFAVVLALITEFQSSIVGNMINFNNEKGNCQDTENSSFYNLKYQKGIVTYNDATYEDGCLNTRVVKEYYCSNYGNLVKRNIGCKYNEFCEDGACVSSNNSVYLIIPFSGDYYNKLGESVKKGFENNSGNKYYLLLENGINSKKNLIILGSPCDYKDQGKAFFKDKIKWSCDEQTTILKENPGIGIYWQKNFGKTNDKWMFNVSIEKISCTLFKDDKIYFLTSKEVIGNLARNKTACQSIDLNKDNLINGTDEKVFNDRYNLFLIKSCQSQECVSIDYNKDNKIDAYDLRIFDSLYDEDTGNRCGI